MLSMFWPYWRQKRSIKVSVLYGNAIDDSTIYIPETIMNILNIVDDDMVWVQLKGKKRVLSVRTNFTTDNVYLSRATYLKLDVKQDDNVIIGPCESIKKATSVTLYPTAETAEFSGSIFCDFLHPHFKDKYRFIEEGDVLKIRCDIRQAKFDVINVQPHKFGIVAHDTQIKLMARSTESVTPQEDVLELIRCLGRTLDYATSYEYGSGIASCATLVRRLEALLLPPPVYEE